MIRRQSMERVGVAGAFVCLLGEAFYLMKTGCVDRDSLLEYSYLGTC